MTRPSPCGLSANAKVSWRHSAFNNLSPPSLRGSYSASTLLWGNPTSLQASVTRRCLLMTYRPCGPEEISWGKVEQHPAAPALPTSWPPPDTGRRARRHTGPGPEAYLRVHLRSVLRYASGFHPTRPRGKDDFGAVVLDHLVQLPSACGCLRQAPQRTFTSIHSTMPSAPPSVGLRPPSVAAAGGGVLPIVFACATVWFPLRPLH